MKLSNFNFDLPEQLLAEYPSEHRDEARLMVLNRKDQTIEHKLFKDLIDYFDEGDVMILNTCPKKGAVSSRGLIWAWYREAHHTAGRNSSN